MLIVDIAYAALRICEFTESYVKVILYFSISDFGGFRDRFTTEPQI